MPRFTDPDFAVLPTEEMARIGKIVADELPEGVTFSLVLVRYDGKGNRGASTVGNHCPKHEGQLLIEVGTNLLEGRSVYGGAFDASSGKVTRIQ